MKGYARLFGFACVVFAAAVMAQSTRIPKVGILWFTDATHAEPYQKGFHEGMQEAGYVHGKNMEVVTRYANANADMVPVLLSELVAMRVDVLYLSSRALVPAKELAGKIPVVSGGFSDPVAEGFAQSLAKPGGNFTGLSWQTAELPGKRLILAREVLPSLKSVGLLYDSKDPQWALEFENYRVATSKAGIEFRGFDLQAFEDPVLLAESIRRAKPQALFVSDYPLASHNRESICRFAIAHGIPLFAESPLFADAGAMMAYGADGAEMFRRATSHVARILRGAKPGDLPIEQANKFFLIVNLKTAAAIGTVIPDGVVLRADRLIR